MTVADIAKWINQTNQRSRRLGHAYTVASVEMSTIDYRELGRPKKILGVPVVAHPKYNTSREFALGFGEVIISCNCGECDFCRETARG